MLLSECELQILGDRLVTRRGVPNLLNIATCSLHNSSIFLTRVTAEFTRWVTSFNPPTLPPALSNICIPSGIWNSTPVLLEPWLSSTHPSPSNCSPTHIQHAFPATRSAPTEILKHSCSVHRPALLHWALIFQRMLVENPMGTQKRCLVTKVAAGSSWDKRQGPTGIHIPLSAARGMVEGRKVCEQQTMWKAEHHRVFKWLSKVESLESCSLWHTLSNWTLIQTGATLLGQKWQWTTRSGRSPAHVCVC